ncbi:MAG: hypothetical protein A3C06_01510 [Candidatus Taylorbacteria bacterium RIFCSPHIGHO2_02_FULL_46_13]|uniref:MobA-like NTP transferase domain-containing protein n=1 Tax=Candidatus Taylorbacteria bacterium RIFCSPHIGHO2_02_FULL_46_13 TaxID=1802312 RepID=A0A1G2MSD9_9BACT|nr:MAG: hypothetical protein A3C06_01510 [Candidatus Taylorbacteria bacterium RIFCSPHIGHO2_02_FULL_46_13]
MDSIKLIILAAGKGKRMNSELPKVLLPLAGKPLLLHLLEAIKTSGLSKPIILVVGVASEDVKKIAGPEYQYVLQKEQLGTGHAVQCAESSLKDRAEHIMVLYGDHPLVDAETIRHIAQSHLSHHNPVTMATVQVDNFDGKNENFKDYGRILRDKNGKIDRIVERKDATPEELNVTEVNPSYFCFNATWLWKNLKHLTQENAQHEYYLTSLPQMAHQNGENITTISINPITALGANTPEQLAILEQTIRENK